MVNELYVICRWPPDTSIDMVHPDSVNAFRKLAPYGKVLRTTNLQAEYVTLSYGPAQYQARFPMLEVVANSAFDIGDTVICEGLEGEALILDAIWHFNRQEAFYLVHAMGRRRSKRYWAADMRLIRKAEWTAREI